jgi:FkbM family methyltransferase
MSEDYPAGFGASEASFGSFEMAAADAARATGDFSTALHWYDSVLALDPAHLEAQVGRCSMLRIMGNPRDALAELIRILAHHPKHLAARLELALTLQRVGRGDEARTIYSLLIREPGAPAEAWHGLALVLLAEGRELAAEIALRRSLALAPNRIEGRQQLADLISRRQDLTAAIDLYHDILAIAPDSAAAHAGLGQALIGLGRMDEARDQLERALAIEPDNATAHLGRARLNLLDGHLTGAWTDMEWRWRQSPRAHVLPPGEPWNGDHEVTGRTILLWADQGIDDAVQMLRYARIFADKGARVILGLPEPLAPLGCGVAGAALTVTSGQALPAGITIDYSVSLSDLPRLFGTTLASIPPAPYVSAPTGHRPRIAAPPGAMLKIGLAWAGSRAAWSIAFPQIMALLGLPHVAMFGLQLGPRTEDSTRLSHPSLLHDLSSTISNHADLAGRIAEMDVVITVDSTIAHLAGAMGKPVWVMLPFAPDWRWMLGRDDSPWYPSARLFRQERPGDWTGVLTRIMMALDDLIAHERDRRQAQARTHLGPKAATRAFLSTHLQSGDLFLDIGAGDGGHTLDAASHPAGDVRVLALDARAREAEILSDTVDISGLSDQVEVLCLALGPQAAPAVVAANPRGGRTVFPLPAWVRAPSRSATLDSLISERSDLVANRLLVRIGARGCESDIAAGMAGVLAAGSIAAIVFEHHDGASAADRIAEAGYRLFRFPSEIAAGVVVPFSGEPGMVLALAAGTEPAAIYGDANDPTSPAAMARAETEAARLAAWGSTELATGRLNPAADLFTKALAQNPNNVEANANLGGLLRRIGRADAAAACWRRALKSGGGAAVRANLANVLRELGHLASSEAAFLQVLAADPTNPRFLYAFGMLMREQGRAKEALATFERVETLAPGTLQPGDLAGALLKSGNLARGMAEMNNRRPARQDEFTAPEWDGARLEARTILVRDEGDAIDTIQLARYLPMVARQGGLVVLECVPELARLLSTVAGLELVVPRGQPLPEADCVVRLLDVPRLIGTTSRTTPPRDIPYLRLPDDVPVFRFPDDGRLRVGVAWSGRPSDRSPPLATILKLAADPSINLISLQRPPALEALTASGGRSFFEEMGSRCTDLAESAGIIAGLDLIIAADCAEAHIAGALGKPVWVLLPLGNDWRWVDGRDDSVWYPTMRVFRQGTDGTWDRASLRIAEALSAMASGKRGRRLL